MEGAKGLVEAVQSPRQEQETRVLRDYEGSHQHEVEEEEEQS